MSNAKWKRRQAVTALILLMAVNDTAGWARVLMGDNMHEPWFLSLARPFMAAVFLWWGISRLIEDATTKRADKDRETTNG